MQAATSYLLPYLPAFHSVYSGSLGRHHRDVIPDCPGAIHNRERCKTTPALAYSCDSEILLGRMLVITVADAGFPVHAAWLLLAAPNDAVQRVYL